MEMQRWAVQVAMLCSKQTGTTIFVASKPSNQCRLHASVACHYGIIKGQSTTYSILAQRIPKAHDAAVLSSGSSMHANSAT